MDGEHLDGLAGVASLFIAATQGVPPQEAMREISDIREVIDYLHTMESPPFPGAVDRALRRARRFSRMHARRATESTQKA